MTNRKTQLDLTRLMLYMLKRIWLVIICAAVGFGAMYVYTDAYQVDTYTARGTMYVYNGNPNLVNYQYTSSSDLNSAVQLLDTYMVVVKSNKVMDAVVERLSTDYPGISAGLIAGSISMRSVSETGVLEVRCTTRNAQMSADICNAVMDVAPAEIIRVVSAGGIEIIDYASVPAFPNGRSLFRKSLTGALAGAVLAGGVLLLLFLLNRKVADEKDITDSYTPPVLAGLRRSREGSKDPARFLLNGRSPMESIENYAKLRMNLLYTLVGKEHRAVEITSAIAGEGKSTIAANLAVSCAMSGKRVLLVDGDLRRACQRDIFRYSRKKPGLSEALLGTADWHDCLLETEEPALRILPAGRIPPNPAEMLSSNDMKKLLEEMEGEFDLVLVDAPPINIVSDPLVLSPLVAGCLFVVRQNYSDHREVRRALIAAEMTGMNVLGFAFYGEKLHQGSYYSRRYYRNYYHKYDTRSRQRNQGHQGEEIS
ncbi:MAG: polysaccharide biosynthesis tyrosine autokinase [Clostridia bacterium]|nr:polysaccharide biosynthesis tyrosine autokinase [Clostridia bacterium]